MRHFLFLSARVAVAAHHSIRMASRGSGIRNRLLHPHCLARAPQPRADCFFSLLWVLTPTRRSMSQTGLIPSPSPQRCLMPRFGVTPAAAWPALLLVAGDWPWLKCSALPPEEHLCPLCPVGSSWPSLLHHTPSFLGNAFQTFAIFCSLWFC